MNAGLWPPGEGKARRPLAVGGRCPQHPSGPARRAWPRKQGEPELRGVSGVLCLALIFYSFLLIINDTDLSRSAVGVHCFQGGDPGPVEGEQLAAGLAARPRGTACGPLPKTTEEQARWNSGYKASRHMCVHLQKRERKEASVSRSRMGRAAGG